MRSRILAAAAIATGAAAGFALPAHAQLFDRTDLRLGPQVVQYRFKAPVDETITEMAIPVFAVMPLGSRLSLDIGTAFAQSRVELEGGTSTVSGLTDTQLRANYTVGSDFVVLTAGVNLPTGRSTVEMHELPAASRIGNDFLGFPISNMGTGAAVTGGIAVARPLGEWSIGAGGSVRVASAFEPVRPDSGATPRYQPGNEYKIRFGADRPIGGGQVALGMTYSTFGRDDFAGSLYNTGDRFLGQVGYSASAPVGMLHLGVWNLYRGAGQLLGAVDIPWDNITNGSATLAIRATDGLTVEPGIQVRRWLQRVSAEGDELARTDHSTLGEAGLRLRLAVGRAAVYPGAGYTIGRLASGAGEHAPLTGFRASVGVQVR